MAGTKGAIAKWHVPWDNLDVNKESLHFPYMTCPWREHDLLRHGWGQNTSLHLSVSTHVTQKQVKREFMLTLCHGEDYLCWPVKKPFHQHVILHPINTKMKYRNSTISSAMLCKVPPAFDLCSELRKKVISCIFFRMCLYAYTYKSQQSIPPFVHYVLDQKLMGKLLRICSAKHLEHISPGCSLYKTC